MQDVEDQTPPAHPMAKTEPLAFRDEDGDINPEFLRAAADAIDGSDTERLQRLVEDFHESDLGDLLEALDTEHRPRLIELLGADFDFAALTEVDDAVREEILEELETATVAEGVRDLDSDDASPFSKASTTGRAGRDSRPAAGHRARRAPALPRLSGGQRRPADADRVHRRAAVLDRRADDRLHARDARTCRTRFYEIFVIDPAGHLLGAVALDRLLRSKRPVTIQSSWTTSPTGCGRPKTRKRWRACSSATTSSRRRWWTMPAASSA